jgi:hypothetical protein
MIVEHQPPERQGEYDEWWARIQPLIDEGVSNGFLLTVCATHDVFATEDEAQVFFDGDDPCIPIMRPLDPRQVNDLATYIENAG